jgi:hypothetical protein
MYENQFYLIHAKVACQNVVDLFIILASKEFIEQLNFKKE